MQGSGAHAGTAVGCLLAVVCALAACGCLLRVRGAEPLARQVAYGEAVMGFGMAAMALPGGMGSAVPPALFVPWFCAAGGWELVLLRRRRHTRGATAHHLHHLTGAAAMVYMAAVAATTPMGAATAGWAPLTAALLAYFAAYVLWAGLRLLPLTAESEAGAPAAAYAGGHGRIRRESPAPAGTRKAIPPTPGLATACRLAMGTGMFAMLLTL